LYLIIPGHSDPLAEGGRDLCLDVWRHLAYYAPAGNF
jgi:hypothetical protein